MGIENSPVDTSRFSDADRAMMESNPETPDQEEYRRLNDHFSDVFVDLRAANTMLHEYTKRHAEASLLRFPSDVIQEVVDEANADPERRKQFVAYLEETATSPFFTGEARQILDALIETDPEAGSAAAKQAS